jgi:lauroyl/myristoyl acyltransferase
VRSQPSHPAITADSTIELFPLAIRRTHFKFQVVGLGSSRSLFLTADETVALKFLRAEKVVSRALARLRRFNARADTRYDELVERLLDIGLVHAIDGAEVAKPYATRWQIASARVRQAIAAVPPYAGRLTQAVGGRIAPIPWMLAVNRAVISRSMSNARKERILARVRRNMSFVFPDAPDAELRRNSEHFLDNFFRTMSELALLQEADDDRICRWVLDTVTRFDVAPIEAALADGKGAIVFHYHMGPIQYVPLLLSALRFKLTLLGMSMARPRRTRMYFSVVDDLRPGGVVKLLRALQRGEVVVIAPDVDIRSPKRTAKDERPELFAGAWQKGSQVPVSFLGETVQSYAGLAWLHEHSGAPLVAASVTRDAVGDVSFQCERFAAPARDGLSRSAWTQQTMDLVYRRCEQELAAHPEQWGHWISFFPANAQPPATH